MGNSKSEGMRGTVRRGGKAKAVTVVIDTDVLEEIEHAWAARYKRRSVD